MYVISISASKKNNVPKLLSKFTVYKSDVFKSTAYINLCGDANREVLASIYIIDHGWSPASMSFRIKSSNKISVETSLPFKPLHHPRWLQSGQDFYPVRTPEKEMNEHSIKIINYEHIRWQCEQTCQHLLDILLTIKLFTPEQNRACNLKHNKWEGKS